MFVCEKIVQYKIKVKTRPKQGASQTINNTSNTTSGWIIIIIITI